MTKFIHALLLVAVIAMGGGILFYVGQHLFVDYHDPFVNHGHEEVIVDTLGVREISLTRCYYYPPDTLQVRKDGTGHVRYDKPE